MKVKDRINENVNSMLVKNQLLVLKEDELVKKYKNNDRNFQAFISGTNRLLDIEPEYFLIMDDSMEKVRTIISENRMNYKNKKETIDKMNEAIISLNKLSHLDSKYKIDLLKDYIENQYKVRRIEEPRKSDAYNLDLNLLANDIVVFSNIINPKQEDEEIEVQYIYSSINYLVNVMPELFDEDLKNRLITILKSVHDAIKINKVIPRRYKKSIIYLADELRKEIEEIKPSEPEDELETEKTLVKTN